MKITTLGIYVKENNKGRTKLCHNQERDAGHNSGNQGVEKISRGIKDQGQDHYGSQKFDLLSRGQDNQQATGKVSTRNTRRVLSHNLQEKRREHSSRRFIKKRKQYWAPQTATNIFPEYGT